MIDLIKANAIALFEDAKNDFSTVAKNTRKFLTVAKNDYAEFFEGLTGGVVSEITDQIIEAIDKRIELYFETKAAAKNWPMFVQDTTLPVSLQAESDRHGETNDCALKAICIATNSPYSLVHKLAKEGGRKNRGGTNGDVLEYVMIELGFRCQPCSYTGKTFRTFKPSNPEQVQLLFSKSHLVAVTRGEIRDWSHGTLRRVFAAFTVEELGEI